MIAAQNPEKQLQGFIRKFDSRHQVLIRAVRKILRRRFPCAHELVYDNYNFFVIGYCSSERPSDCIFSIAAAASGVSLCFMYGARLADSQKLLRGSGKQTRFLRLESALDLERFEVQELLRGAAEQAKTPLSIEGRGELIIRSVSAKQRPRKMPVKAQQAKAAAPVRTRS